jgi:hypothetical protein
MKNEELDTIEMTRHIRDQMYEETKGLDQDQFLRYVKQRSAPASEKVEERQALLSRKSPRRTHP